MRQKRRVLEGIVVSDKIDKTIVVKVERLKKHPLYKKIIKVHKKVKAHDKQNQASKGDYVRVVESRPYSKEKHFVLAEVITRAEKK